jgi:peroxiredoxin
MTLTYSKYDKLQRGDQAPEFSLPGVDGKTYSLKDVQGKKAVAIVFMCNHCPFMRPKFKELVRLQTEYAEKGFQLIGINSNDVEAFPDDSFEAMQKETEVQGFNFLYLFDESQEIAKAYGAACTPDPFLFDKDLKLAYHGRIDDAHEKPAEEASHHDLEEAIQAVLEGKEAPASNPSMGCNVKWKQ